MRSIVTLFLGGLLMTGCVSHRSGAGTSAVASNSETKQSKDKIIITPDAASTGKVVKVNAKSRFAVLNFPIGTVPPVGQMLNAYRQGLKVAELKVSGPGGEENTVADIIKGEVRSGDEVRGD